MQLLWRLERVYLNMEMSKSTPCRGCCGGCLTGRHNICTNKKVKGGAGALPPGKGRLGW